MRRNWERIRNRTNRSKMVFACHAVLIQFVISKAAVCVSSRKIRTGMFYLFNKKWRRRPLIIPLRSVCPASLAAVVTIHLIRPKDGADRLEILFEAQLRIKALRGIVFWTDDDEGQIAAFGNHLRQVSG